LKFAVLFAGQGAQRVGMGQDIIQRYPRARAVFRRAEECSGLPLSRLCFEGPEEELALTVYTQPCLLAVEAAIWAVLEEWGVTPWAVAGLSVGEYGALVAAGSLELDEAIRLVCIRARLMHQACRPGETGMLAVLGLTEERVRDLCTRASRRGMVEAANFNCPGQVVVAGELRALRYLAELAKEAGARRVIPLRVSAAFHTSLMRGVAEELGAALDTAEVRPARVPVVANAWARYVRTPQEIRQALRVQVYSPVLWEQTLRLLARDGVETFVEVGPGRVLSGFVQRTLPGARAVAVEDLPSLESLLEISKGGLLRCC